MQENRDFLLLEKLKNTESAQLRWVLPIGSPCLLNVFKFFGSLLSQRELHWAPQMSELSSYQT